MIKQIFITIFICTSFLGKAQQQEIMVWDFENKPQTSTWWIDNKNVKFDYDTKSENQVHPHSKVCLHLRWDAIPASQPAYTWFTDIKADTFVSEGMTEKWKLFKENTWLSFYYKIGTGDSLMLHPLILSKGHKSKWGSSTMIPCINGKWTFVKIKFANLKYEDWGKIVQPLNLNSDSAKCFEVGLRLGKTSIKGFIEAWFDEVKLTNYEPVED